MDDAIGNAQVMLYAVSEKYKESETMMTEVEKEIRNKKEILFKESQKNMKK